MRKFIGSLILLLLLLLTVPWGQRLLLHQIPAWVIRDGGFDGSSDGDSDGGFRSVPDQVVSVGDLTGYYFAPKGNQPTIFFAHGNSSRQQRQVDRLSPALVQGYGLYYVTYPGYDQNLIVARDNALGWVPQLFSEAGAKAALQDHWQAYRGLGGQAPNTILAAESLGTALMPWFAAHLPEAHLPEAQRPKMLVIMAGFDEFTNVARAKTFGLVQPSWLYDPFDNDGVWEALDIPVFVANGDQDWMVSEAHGRAAERRIPGPSHFELYAGYGHLDLPLGRIILDAVSHNFVEDAD